ncbi:MAG: c-type cytochrome [Pseudomonadota bacterium]
MTSSPIRAVFAGLSAMLLGACSTVPTQTDTVAQGEYLVGLLGCGQCHTGGALLGQPDGAWLAGSNIGIAYSYAEDEANPGIVFAGNLTPDPETGLGGWRRDDVVAAISAGRNHSGEQMNRAMPWLNYAQLRDADLEAIADYLLSLQPVRNPIPDNVPRGEPSTAPYVRIGVYVFTSSNELEGMMEPASENAN